MTILERNDRNNWWISIHTLRVEGDSICRDLRFWGRISIHTLRVEGDFASTGFFRSSLKFQSTPSEWRVTLLIGEPAERLFYFNPHPPSGGWQTQKTIIIPFYNFNPHPPSGGWLLSIRILTTTSRFQSTPSEWRVTYFFKGDVVTHLFQSTPSEWRVTSYFLHSAKQF